MKIQGYASLFSTFDLSGDIIHRAAFNKCLSSVNPERIKMLYQHETKCPVGVWKKFITTPKGLWVEGELTTNSSLGADAAALVGSGALDGLSIGFRTRKAQKIRSGRRKLLEIDLLEISLVTFPMQPEARLESVSTSVSNENVAEIRKAALRVAKY